MFSPEGYEALTHGAAVVRRGDRGVLSVTGADRLSWLQGLLTNDIEALALGAAADAAYLTPQGRMITDARVVRLEDRALLDVPASLAEALSRRFAALLFSEDAQIADVSNVVAIVEVHGPRAPGLVPQIHPATDRPPLAGYEMGGMLRDDAFARPGYVAFVQRSQADALVAELLTRGALEATLETLDVIRVESGRPAFLVDMDEHTIPLEAGLEQRAISFSKGCYVGQEVIVRVMHRGGGRVAKRLVGLRCAPGELPKRGARIFAGERDIGELTSVVWSPLLRQGIGLGTVHRDFTEPGTPVLMGEQVKHEGFVAALPFVERWPVKG